MNRYNPKIGEKFSRLTVLSQIFLKSKSGKTKDRYVTCLCNCGEKKDIRVTHLCRNVIRSCGCLRLERIRTHLGSGTRIYRIYKMMNRRCNDIKNESYKNYGKKGIKVSEDWNTFEKFRDWAFKNGYQPHLTIDRINPKDGYRPENCEWVSREENARRVVSKREEIIENLKEILRGRYYPEDELT